MKHCCSSAIVIIAFLAAAPLPSHAQRRGRGGAGDTPRSAAPIDLTGYWVSVVTEDWKFRMVTPRKGDYDLVPLTPAGRTLADSWDPAKDEAAGNQCKSYGAPGIMRAPGRLHITWENDTTLRMEIEAGSQTRLFHFGQQAPAGEPKTWQGYSTAEWEFSGGGRGQTRNGNLKAVTDHLRPGYLRKNGVPYSERATMTEHIRRFTTPNGDQWLLFITEVNDPEYLTIPFVTSTQFKKLPDGSAWKPEPCSVQ